MSDTSIVFKFVEGVIAIEVTYSGTKTAPTNGLVVYSKP